MDATATSAGSDFEYSPYTSDEWPLLSKGLRGGKSRRRRVESLLRWMIASEDAKNPLQTRKQGSLIRIWLAISAYKEGMKWWNQGSLRRHKCNVHRIRFLAKSSYMSVDCLDRGSCLVGITGFKPGDMDYVRIQLVCFGHKRNVQWMSHQTYTK